MNAPLRTIVKVFRMYRIYNGAEFAMRETLHRDYNAERHYAALNTIVWFMYGV